MGSINPIDKPERGFVLAASKATPSAPTENFFEQTQEQARKRLEELRPYVEEFRNLERLVNFMERGPEPTTRRRGGGRRRVGERRSDEFLEIIRENPGLSIPDIADRMGLKNKTYLYRVARELQDEGAVRKEGDGFVPTNGNGNGEAEPAAA